MPVPTPLDPADDDPLGIALDPEYVLPRRLRWWADHEPDRPFLTDVDGGSVNYGEADRVVRRWCAALHDLGVEAGERVITMLPTSTEAQLVWLALGTVGAVEVPVDPQLRGGFLEHALRDPDARRALVRPELVELVSSAAVGLDIHAIERDGSFAAGHEPTDRAAFPSPTDTACVIYTSGTTGPSKGVVISWAQMASTIGRIPRTWFGPDDAVYAHYPMFHVAGRSPLPAMLDVGGRVVCREKTSVSAFWDDVRVHGCTSTTVNTALLLSAPERPDDRDHPVRVAFTAGSRSAALRFIDRFGVALVEAYGSTEAGFPIVLRPIADDGRRVCGYLRPGYEARIVDDGRDVDPGDAGELWVKPPARPLMTSGYLGRDDLTGQAIVDGWYRTGDRMRRHDDGAFEFVDRMRDTIRRLGENISSAALEVEIMSDPAISVCAAVPVPDEVAGHEILVAAIVADGIDLAAPALHARLSQRLPKHMVPRYVAVVDELPRTSTMKIRKADLLEHLDEASIWEAPGRAS